MRSGREAQPINFCSNSNLIFPAMLARIPLLRSLIRPNHKATDLKYLLINTLRMDGLPSRERVLKTLTVYDKLHKYVEMNRQSNLKAQNLNTLFYSRYYTTKSFLLNTDLERLRKRHLPVIDDGVLADARLLRNILPTVDDAQLKKTFTSRIRDPHMAADQIYLTGLEDHLCATAPLFLRMERLLFEQAPFQQDFAGFFLIRSRETEVWVQKNLERDIRHLTKPLERVKLFMLEQKVVASMMGGMVMGLLTIFGVWMKFR